MPYQAINTGSADNDPSAESVRGAFTKCNSNFGELYGGVTSSGGIPAFNVKSAPYNAAGNDSTDDTAAIQGAITAASNAGGGLVVLPAGIYKITSTIVRPHGIEILGIGRGGTTAAPQPCRIKWYGATNGLMMTTDTTANGASIASTPTTGIYFDGRDVASTCYRFVGGPIDQGTGFYRCQFHTTLGNQVEILNGATNMHFWDCRWDQFRGYAIYCDVSTGTVFLTIDGGCTSDNINSGTVEGSAGFLYLDGTNAVPATQARANVRIRDWHPEANGEYKTTYPAGIEEAERRGVIRLGVNPLYGGGKIQFSLALENIAMSVATATAPYCLVQFTSPSGTLTDHQNAARITFWHVTGLTRWNGNTEWNKLIGNVPTALQWPYEGDATVNKVRQVGSFVWSPNTTVSTERFRNHVVGADAT